MNKRRQMKHKLGREKRTNIGNEEEEENDNEEGRT